MDPETRNYLGELGFATAFYLVVTFAFGLAVKLLSPLSGIVGKLTKPVSRFLTWKRLLKCTVVCGLGLQSAATMKELMDEKKKQSRS